MEHECVIPVIIPSLDPNDNLIKLLSKLKAVMNSPIVIVNDGSPAEYDSFYETAQSEYGAVILRHDVNRGKGCALRTAFSYCLDMYPDMIGCVTADSDGQHTPKDIKAVMDEMVRISESSKGHDDETLVLGVRQFDLEHVPKKSSFGNNTTRKVFRFLYRQDISDTQTGLRAIPCDLMKELLDVKGDRFEYEMNMLIFVASKHIPIVEVPIETIYDSKENHSTHFRAVVDSVKIYSLFFMTIIKYALSSLSACVIDLILFQLFCNIFKSTIGGVIYVTVANVLARVISATYNYIVNFYFVFSSHEKHMKSVAKYALLALDIMIISTVLNTFFVSVTNVSKELYVKIPVDVTLFFVGYFVQKKWIYK